MNTSLASNRDATLIAFCGIDGSGKTSLLENVRDLYRSSSSLPLSNSYEIIFRTERYCSRTYGDGRDWLEGTFAQTIAIASCFDLVRHYETCIEPALKAHKIVFADRYELCYRAYLDTVGSTFSPDALFSKLKKPDLTILVDAPTELLEQRYAERGGASEAETLEMADRSREAYYSLIQNDTGRSVTIVNDADFETAATAARKAVAALLTPHQST